MKWFKDFCFCISKNFDEERLDEFLVEDFNHIKSQFESIGEELVNFQKTA